MAQLVQSAWQPITPRGVAAFARASLRRLFTAQLIVAALAALVVVWFLGEAWSPTVRAAIRQLPAQGEIRRGELVWRGDSPSCLAKNQFLAVVVDLWHEGRLARESHVTVEFGRKSVRIFSLLGYVEARYPRGWVIGFNRGELEPWWGAWQPWILVGVAASVMIGLLSSWLILATAYWLPTWLVGLLGNRDLDWQASWRLAAAALMPGALFFLLAILAYGVALIDPVQLLVAAGVHLAVGWLYVLISPLFLPQHPGADARSNPFAGARSQGSDVRSPKSGRGN